jgi:hypothetical protein
VGVPRLSQGVVFMRVLESQILSHLGISSRYWRYKNVMTVSSVASNEPRPHVFNVRVNGIASMVLSPPCFGVFWLLEIAPRLGQSRTFVAICGSSLNDC